MRLQKVQKAGRIDEHLEVGEIINQPPESAGAEGEFVGPGLSELDHGENCLSGFDPVLHRARRHLSVRPDG